MNGCAFMNVIDRLPNLIVTTLDQKLTAAQQQLSDPAKAASEAASGARVVVLGVRRLGGVDLRFRCVALSCEKSAVVPN